MSKNVKITELDPQQIERRTYQEDMDAQRVMLVGGEKLDLSIDNDKLIAAITQGLSKITINQPQQLPALPGPNLYKDVEFVTIEKPVIVEKIVYKEIEKPVFITKTEYKTIEIPIVIKETEFKEVEKERHYPLVLKVCAVVQAVTVVCILLINLFK